MSSVLVTGIGELVTHDASHGPGLGVVRDAAAVLTDGVVSWTGSATSATESGPAGPCTTRAAR